MTFDATLVALIALLIFLGLAWRLNLHKTVAAMLDKRGEEIAHELNEAKRLRTEAEALKAEHEARRASAETEAAEIVAAAKQQAQALAAEAREQMKTEIARRQKQAEDSIARAEQQAAAEVRAAAAEAAIAAAEKMLRGDLGADAHARLVDQGAKELATKFA